MTYLFLELALMLGLGAIVYLIAIAAPRVQDDQHFGDNLVKNWIKRIPLDRIDGFIAGVNDKALRRTKVWILRADNFVSKHLNKDKNIKPL